MGEPSRAEIENELGRLKSELAERTASIPIHSIRPHQLIQIEELEERIEELEQKLSEA